MDHDQWFAFTESLLGLKGDPASLNPAALRDLVRTGYELSQRPNPFEQADELREQVATQAAEIVSLKSRLAAAKKASKNGSTTRNTRPA